MNAAEFTKWFKFHRTNFPGIDGWIAKMADGQKRLDANTAEPIKQADLAGAWFDALKDVPVKSAMEATRRMFRGDEEEPRSFDAHPKAIRAIAKKLGGDDSHGKPKPFGPRTIKNREGEYDESFHCSLCKDWGLVSIIHDETIKAYRAGTYFIDRGIDRDGNQRPKGRRLMTADAICTCEAGARRQHIDARTYDPSRDLLAPFGNEGCDEAIKKFVECPIDAFSEWQ